MGLCSWSFWVDILITATKFFWFLIEGIFKAVLPLTYLAKPITNETALITDAGKGIGRKLAIELAKRGNTVVVWDEDAEAVEETAGEIEKFGGEVYYYQVDMSVQENVIAAAAEIRQQVPTPISLLINNSNLLVENIVCRPVPDTNTLRKLMDVNIMSHFWTIKEFLPSMIEAGQGHLVAFAHIPDDTIKVHTVDYAASKSAVTGLMESVSEMLEDVRSEVVCTTVFPGIIEKRPLSPTSNDMIKSFLGPVKVDDMVKTIIQAIQMNKRVVYVPRVNVYWVILKHFLPIKAFRLLRRQFLNKMVENTTIAPLENMDTTDVSALDAATHGRPLVYTLPQNTPEHNT